MFFDSWTSLLRVIIVGTLAYAMLVFLLRVSGKRTLSKMNAFDLVVTVALGSTLATVLLSRDVPLAMGVTAFAMLVGLQYAVTWLSVRSRTVSRLVKAEPALLLYQGRFLQDALRRERVLEEEVLAALRSNGVADLDKVHAVVLETDGSFTTIKQEPEESGRGSLRGVHPVREERPVQSRGA